MDPTLRLILGAFTLLSGAMCAYIASGASGASGAPPNPVLYGVAAACVLITLGCIEGKVGKVALRLFAGGLSLFFGYGLATTILSSNPKDHAFMEVVNSLLVFVLVGLPCGAFAINENLLSLLSRGREAPEAKEVFLQAIAQRKGGQTVTCEVVETPCDNVADARKLSGEDRLHRVGEKRALDIVIDMISRDQFTNEELLSREEAQQAVEDLIEQIYDEDDRTYFFLTPKEDKTPFCFVASTSFGTAILQISDATVPS